MSSDSSPHCLVLDAMGVLFCAADDVAELLIPFIRSAGGEADPRVIEAAYLEASLGRIDADRILGARWVERGRRTRLLGKAPRGCRCTGVSRKRPPGRHAGVVLVERRRPMVEALARVARPRAVAGRRRHQQRRRRAQTRSPNLRAPTERQAGSRLPGCYSSTTERAMSQPPRLSAFRPFASRERRTTRA